MKRFKKFAGLMIVIFVAMTYLAIRFSNPDMTETRLFIEFWHIWVGWFISLYVALWMIGVFK